MSGPGSQTGMRRDHFAKLVSHWSHFGPPLRPSPFDTGVLRQVASGLPAAPRVVVLGLTPETIGLSWPANTVLLALDHSTAMVGSLWPIAGAPAQSGVALAEWLKMPLANAAADIVCADGCHTQLAYPRGYTMLSKEVYRVLKPAGRHVTRVFIRPDAPETMEAITEAMARGAIGSVHALKLRLLAAVHGHSGIGSCLGDAWEAWRRLPALPQGMAGKCGWTAEEVVGIEGYAGLATRYYLPTLDELRAIHGADFTEIECRFGDYELAERCPTLVLERRG